MRALPLRLIIVSIASLTITFGTFGGCSRPDSEPAPALRSTPAPVGPVAGAEVIYGKDNRHEWYEEKNAVLRHVADSTVILVKTADLTQNGSDSVLVRGTPFGEANRLCKGEPYFDQETPGFCSGFLIAEDLVVTAGHCITSALDCSEVSFVFGYSYKTPKAAPRQIPGRDVYKCASVLHTQAPAKGADFAVVRLDRPVTHREPVKLRHTGAAQNGDDVVVVGYPSGLPMKIADGARVRDASPNGYFIANTDTYGGNSGSAVFNARTLEIEGVLVRGEVDFAMRPEGCMVSNVCPDDGCRGEDITRISEVAKFLKQNSIGTR